MCLFRKLKGNRQNIIQIFHKLLIHRKRSPFPRKGRLTKLRNRQEKNSKMSEKILILFFCKKIFRQNCRHFYRIWKFYPFFRPHYRSNLSETKPFAFLRRQLKVFYKFLSAYRVEPSTVILERTK